MSKYESAIIEEHPTDTLLRIKALLDLYGSVDWDSPMLDAADGARFLLADVRTALGHVIDQTAGVDLEHFVKLD